MLPAEWAPQSAMLFVWPRRDGDWGTALQGARETIAQAAAAVAKDQPVIIIAPDEESQNDIESQRKFHGALAARRNNVSIQQVPANDIWIRDFGPLTLFEHGQRSFLDCRFNGWGGKFPAQLDDQVAKALVSADRLGAGCYQRRDYLLEGGAIDSNDAGALLVTRCCLLGSARNPDDSEDQWNRRFREDLGIETVHWLDHGQLQGDDTDGHVDTLARFVGEAAIAYQGCDDPADSHYQPLNAMATQLQQLRQSNGQPYQLHALPLPQAQYDEDGRRLPAGYANFLIANQVVLVPQYNDPADTQARRIIAACFPQREIVAIDCRPLIRQNGAIHCAAMQIPKCPQPS